MLVRICIYSALLGIAGILGSRESARAGMVQSPEVAQTVVIADLVVLENSVTGTAVNKSWATIRELKLALHQEWHWSDEHHPGFDSPGRVLAFTLEEDILPQTNASFRFVTPPLPRRSDGRFVTSMHVTGFTEVGP
jgi:hypothetical protein